MDAHMVALRLYAFMYWDAESGDGAGLQAYIHSSCGQLQVLMAAAVCL